MLISSCIGDTLQHQFVHINKEGWNRNDTAVFTLPPAKENGQHCISTEIRTTSSFPYQKLYLVREILLEKPLAVHRDTICMDTGTRGILEEGKGVSLMSFSHNDSTLFLNEGQSGNIRLYHIMSREQLKHITEVGIKLGTIR